jgi:hypothetical protein
MIIQKSLLISFLLSVWIFVSSWSGVLRPHDRITLPIISLILLGLSLIILRSSKINYKNLILLFIVFILLSLVHLINSNFKTINYILVYILFFTSIFYIFNTAALSYSKNIEKINFQAVFFIFVIIFLEILLPITFDFDIYEIIPRSKDNTATIDGVYKRAYGFSTEPTQLCNYLLTSGMCAMAYVFYSKKKINFYIFFVIWVLCVFLTNSATGLIILFLNLAILLFRILYKGRLKKKNFKTFLKAIFFISLLFVLILQVIPLDFIIESLKKLMLKLSLSEASSSSLQRLQLLKLSLKMFIEKPFFGFGFGYMSSEGLMSSINWYAFLLAEGGLFTVVLVVFIISICLKPLNYKKISVFHKLAIFNGFIYLFFISTFYSMGLWVAIYLSIGKYYNDN